MTKEEVFAWLTKKDPYTLMDLERLMKKDQHPVIISNEDYEFYLGCMNKLKRMKNAITELLKDV